MVQRQLDIGDFWGRANYEPYAISTSVGFSHTSRQLVQEKLDFFGLQNVVLIEGSFDETLDSAPLKTIAAALIDCDLYQGYQDVLSRTASRLSKWGIIPLDEYFSLKFPGEKIAVDEFLRPNGEYRLDEFSHGSNGFLGRQLVRE